jgi:ribosomal protein L37AE/L43A
MSAPAELIRDLARAFDLEMVERRETAARSQPLCPACESEQVQLVDWRQWPVVFKCRHCKRRFEVTHVEGVVHLVVIRNT